MQNIEFKAELRDLDAARVQCRTLGAAPILDLEQTDTYYKLPDGRLKRREAPGEPVEWIFYHRKDRIRPALSTFSIISDRQARRRWGADRLETWLVVRKRRSLWMLENVRIHLDVVEELGTFLEFEALVDLHHPVKECQLKVQYLREQFQPLLGEAIAVGYSDLMAQGIARA